MKLHFDKQKCTGCCACQMACMDQRDIRPLQGQTSLCRIETLERAGQLYYRFVHCVQCGKCSEVCPTEGLYAGFPWIDSSGYNSLHSMQSLPRGLSYERHLLLIQTPVPSSNAMDASAVSRTAGYLPVLHTCPTGAVDTGDRLKRIPLLSRTK